MKKSTIILGLALAMLAACDKEQPEAASGAPVTLNVAVVQDGVLTRAADDIQSVRLLPGEAFNAYLTNCTVSETVFTMNADGVTATAASQPFVMKGRTAKVVAVYPVAATTATTSWTVALDQTTEADYKASDLMYASATIAASGRADVTFQHRMAKIIIKAAAGEGIGEIRDIRIIKGNRTVDIGGTGLIPGSAVSDPVDNTDANCLKVFEGGTEGYADCAALLPPQTIDAGTGTADRFLEVATNKGPCWFNLRSASGSSVTFESGKSYTLVLPVDADIIGLTATITPWVQTADQVVFTEL